MSTTLAPELVAACAKRRARLREAMTGVDALLIGHARDICYLTGFIGDDSLLIVPADDDAAIIVTDARHDTFLKPWVDAGAAEVVMGTRHHLGGAVEAECAKRGLSKLGVQAEHLTIVDRNTLASDLASRTLVETTGLVGGLRMIKDDLEVAAIERAVSIHEDAMRATIGQVAVGMPENELCAILEYEMKVRGAAGPSFGTCVSTGAHSAVIHHLTGPTPIEAGVLLLDWGAIHDGYCSDMTRTFGVDGMPDRIREIYDIVLEAQTAAIEACGPGKVCAEIDGVARRIITDAGYGDYFGHGLGHGLGLDIHEAPWFNAQATDTVLEPGNVMTVEPGIYLPGIGGVRIEDDVLITPDGYRVLTSYPKSPDEAVLEPARAGGVV